MMRCCMRVCLSSSHLLLLSSSRSIRTRDACYRANPKQHVTLMHPAPPSPNAPVPVSPGRWLDGSWLSCPSERSPAATHTAAQRHRIIYVRHTWLCPAGPTPTSALFSAFRFIRVVSLLCPAYFYLRTLSLRRENLPPIQFCN